MQGQHGKDQGPGKSTRNARLLGLPGNVSRAKVASVAGIASLAWAATTSIAGCSVPTEDLPRPGSCEPFELTGVSPAAGSSSVPADAPMAVSFNDFPDPETVSGANISLYTGFYFHTGRYWVDLVERRALFKPSQNLNLGLGYTLLVKTGIRSLRSCRLQPPAAVGDSPPADAHTFRFQVAAPGVERPPVPVPAPPATYGQLMAVFAGHCAGAGCHLGSPPAQLPGAAPGVPPSASDGCLAVPGGGLSLCDRDAHDALVGVPSRQVVPQVLVAPGDSSRSYLLRKVIGAPPVVGHSGVPGDNLSQDDKQVIQGWIDRGAPGPAASPTKPADGGV